MSRKCWRSSGSATASIGCRRRSPAVNGAASRLRAPWRRSQRLLLFDDPTTGLDPILATMVDDEIVKLRDLQHVTSFVVTHQIRDAYYIATHQALSEEGRVRIAPAETASLARAEFMVLHEGRIRFDGSATDLLASGDPYRKDFLFRTLPPW